MTNRKDSATWTSVAEAPYWLEVPPNATEEWRAWAIAVVRDSLGLVDEARIGPDDAALNTMAADAVGTLCDFAAALELSERVIAAVGVAGRTPIPVLVEVAQYDPSEPADLLAVCGATGGTPIDPPDVEYPSLGEDGDAIRVTRVDRDDGGVVWASIALARRTESTDTVLLWRTTDLELVPYMPELLDELLGAIEIEGVAA